MNRHTDIQQVLPEARPGRSAGEEIAQYVRVLWRRRWLIAAVTLLMLALAYWLLGMITPLYTASAKVMIDARRTQVVNNREVVSQLPPQLITVMGEVEVIRSRSLAVRVADKLNLWNDPEFNPTLRPVPTGMIATLRLNINEWLAALRSSDDEMKSELVDKEEKTRQLVIRLLQGRIDASPVAQSLVIQINVVSENPLKAQRIVNMVAEQYVLDQLESKFDAARQASTWLNSRLDELRQNVQTADRAVAEYRARTGLLEGRTGLPAQQQLGELNSQLIIAQAKRAETEGRVTRMEAVANSPNPSAALENMVDSPLIQRLKEQEAQLAREISDFQTRYGEKHPRMVKALAEQEELERKMRSEVSKLVQTVRNELLATRSREAALREQIRRIEDTVTRQGQAGIRLQELEREANANRLLFETFLNRFKETSEQQQLQQPDSRVISAAALPFSPSAPRRNLFLTGALLLGALLGLLLALVLEALQNTFMGREQLEDATGIPTLGMTPQTSGRSGVNVQLFDKPNSAFAESFRSVWVGLKHGNQRQSPRIVAITSSLPGEGKSVTALTLARTVALLGNKVALVEGDLRRASQMQKSGVQPKHFVHEILTGEASPEDVVVADRAKGLDLYLAQSVPGSPLDLLGSPAMQGFLETLRHRYDLVVIDCPPILPVADTQILARLADATVFLVQWGKTPKGAVKSGLRMLDEVSAPIAGTLLSQVNIKRHAKYGYGDSGSYYGRYKKYYTS